MTRCLYIIQIGTYWKKNYLSFIKHINQEIKLQITGTVFVASDSDNLLLPALPWFLDFNRKTIKGKKGIIVVLRLASRLPIILLRRIVLFNDNVVTISFINLDQFLGTIVLVTIVWYHFIVMRFVHFLSSPYVTSVTQKNVPVV